MMSIPRTLTSRVTTSLMQGWQQLQASLSSSRDVTGHDVVNGGQLASRLTRDFLPGHVWLVGAGPGDLSMLSMGVYAALKVADVIVYDRLVSDAILAEVPVTTERYYVGKSAGHHSVPQAQIETKLIELAERGLRVLRLKGGDPFVFGRGGEELMHLLEAGVPCKVLPGITAAAGCAASTSIPLTYRGIAQSCRFITGHLQEGKEGLDLSQWYQPSQTLVFYMGLAQAGAIAAKLMSEGAASDLPVAIVERGSQPDQKVWETTLEQLESTIQQHGCQSPALLIVGEVVALRQKLTACRSEVATATV